MQSVMSLRPGIRDRIPIVCNIDQVLKFDFRCVYLDYMRWHRDCKKDDCLPLTSKGTPMPTAGLPAYYASKAIRTREIWNRIPKSLRRYCLAAIKVQGHYKCPVASLKDIAHSVEH
jgi:hypothetical protein